MKKGYVIWQEQDDFHNLGGYWQGDHYTVQGEVFGCFDKDISKAKIYTSKARAKNAMKSLYFENSDSDCMEVREIETEDTEN